MPRPPSVDSWPETKFITSYFLQGCKAPFALIAEFSQEPAKDLWLMLLVPDLEDMVKDWLRPGGGRKRSPARHGRKSGRASFTLDPQELVGSRARARFGPYPGIKLPGARALFRIADNVDRVNWTAAVLEGITNLGFETLWGILSFKPDLCPQLSYVMRRRTEPTPIIGASPDTVSLDANILVASNKWAGGGPFAYTTFEGPFNIAGSVTIFPLGTIPIINWKFQLRTSKRGVIASSQAVSLDIGERATMAVDGRCEAGEFVSFTRTAEQGSFFYTDMTVLGFAEKMWL